MSSYGDYEPVIGLEIHAQLQTKSKMFCHSSTHFGDEDNFNTDPVCLGMPGTLPVPNYKAVELSIKAGIALNCKIDLNSVFARKQYFYPDLPKGYQISQADKPICSLGYVEFYTDGEKRRISIERAHMEEDAGKSLHQGEFTLVNFNRAGIPLLEIVSGPDLRAPKEAADYARTVKNILSYLEVCNGNLEEGSLRCDCNVSVRKKGVKQFGTRVEIKNVNSFKFVEKSIDYEIKRQIASIESGQEIVQETRLYDATKNKTFAMRKKEQAQDYRYFPDPDLLPVLVTQETIEKIKSSMPELPLAKAERLASQYGLPAYDAQILTQSVFLANFFEEATGLCKNAKSVSNWMMGEVLKKAKEDKLEVEEIKISSKQIAELVEVVDAGLISGTMAKKVFEKMWGTEDGAKKLISSLGLTLISDEGKIKEIIKKIVDANPDGVAQFQAGKTNILGFFVGQVMKQTKGQANPETVSKLLKDELAGG